MDTIAYYIGADNDFLSVSNELAASIGFKEINKFTNLAQIELQTLENPVCFFLFDETQEVKSLKKIVDRIRACKRHKIRFFPLIYLCSNPSPDIIRQTLALGFDDVIIKPFNNNIKTRLQLQIDKNIIYYETSEYFGPDRRRLDSKQKITKRETQKGIKYCQYKFLRCLENGTKIIEKKILVS